MSMLSINVAVAMNFWFGVTLSWVLKQFSMSKAHAREISISCNFLIGTGTCRMFSKLLFLYSSL